MRLVDFLVALLEAHGQSLARLAAFFGEERFMDMLESSADQDEFGREKMGSPGAVRSAMVERAAKAETTWLDFPPPHASDSAYGVLEGAVRTMDLAEVLEFHLWAYPHYRAFIESALDLNAKIKPSALSSAAPALVEEALVQARGWFDALPIPEPVRAAALSAHQQPWIRFRTEVLKKLGHRPFGAV